MFEAAMRWWCRTMHDDVFHPVHGKYICGRCLREWPVPWGTSAADGRAGMTPQPQTDRDSDLVVTSPGRGRLLIRLPIRSFRSTPAAPLAGGDFSNAQAGTQSR